MIYNLQNQHISSSFQGLLQISSSAQIYNGTGTLVSKLSVGYITGSLDGTASYATNSGTASYLIGYTAINTGSLATTGSNSFQQNQYITGSLVTTSYLQAGNYGKTYSGALIQISSSQTMILEDATSNPHGSIFVDYLIVGTNAGNPQRAGTLKVCSNSFYGGTQITLNEITTLDIVSTTADVTFTASIGPGANNRITATIATGSAWNVYYTYKLI